MTKMSFATPCSSGMHMSLVTHLLPQTKHRRQKEHMPSGNKGVSTVQIPGSSSVPTPNMGLLWGHRARKPKDTALDCLYSLFSVLLTPTGLMLLRRWRARCPTQATITIPPEPSSISTGSSLQKFLNYSSGTLSTICQRQNSTLPLLLRRYHHKLFCLLCPRSQLMVLPSTSSPAPHKHHAVSHLTTSTYAVHLLAVPVLSSLHLVLIKTQLNG